MYLKITALNNIFSLKFLDQNSNEVVPYSTSLLIKLYNEIDKKFYLFQESNVPEFELLFDKITNNSNIYVDIYLDNKLYKTKVKVNLKNTEVVLQYKTYYNSTYPIRMTSNTFLKRISIGMPRWSSAFKNDISIFSKAFYPLYLFSEKIYYKTNEHLENNINYIKHTQNIKLKDEPLYISNTKNNITEYIPKTYIKEKERINKVTSKIILSNSNRNLVTFTNDNEYMKLDNIFNKIFVRTKEECYVTILGYDKYNNIISERLYSNKIYNSMSFNNYKEIIKVYSDTYHGNITCSNYLDCTDTKSNVRYSYKLTGSISDSKEILVPYYKFNNDTNSLNVYFIDIDPDLNLADYEDSYYIPAMRNHKGYYVSEYDDIIFLNENNKLCYGLLRKNLETDMKLHPSNNNNTIVSTLNDNVASDNSVEFMISTKTIIEMYGNYSCKISSIIDGNIYYLNEDNEWVEKEVYKTIMNITPIYITQDTTNISYMSIVVEANGINYQASIIKNNIEIIETELEFDSILHNGTNLIGTINNEYYNIELIKDYYEFIDDTLINYKNYTDDTSVINIKGYKDDKYII